MYLENHTIEELLGLGVKYYIKKLGCTTCNHSVCGWLNLLLKRTFILESIDNMDFSWLEFFQLLLLFLFNFLS